ncbi:MAG: hypothetical protein ACR2H4_18765 [Pyrinomonadaceae bacterium]
MAVNLDYSVKLYAVALFAIFPEESNVTPDGVNHIDVPLRLEACAILAMSPDDAREQGAQRERELWPAAQGWFGHSVSVSEIDLPGQVTPTIEQGARERIM